MDKIDVAGLKVDPLTKQQFFAELENRISHNQKTFITTLYSEFLYAGLQSKEAMNLLNRADLAIPDGIGVIWAQYFLSKPFHVDGFWGRVIQAWGQVVNTGAQILLAPKQLYKVFPEKLVGADLFWDLGEWAEKKHHSIYLLGWPEQDCEKVKGVLEKRFPEINIAGFANATPKDESVQEDINEKQPDLLMVAFGPMKQERWIVEHLPKLDVKAAIGLGGSFDYAIGKKIHPPKFIRAAGLEWLYRLFTQPTRLKRIYQAFWGLILSLVRYKVFMSMPLRKNGLAVVVNKEDNILVCKRSMAPDRATEEEQTQNNYWQFPQGGIGKNESITEGTKRELEEETGIRKVEVIGVSKFTNSYFWQNARRPLTSSKKYSGQEQHTVYFRFKGKDDEIDLDHHELTDYEWLPAEEAIHRVAEERRDHAEKAIKELEELLKNK